MISHRFSRTALVLLFFAVPGLAGRMTEGHDRVGRPEAIELHERLQQATDGKIDARLAPETGAYDFVRATAGAVLAPDDAGAPPEVRALRFLGSHGALLGLSEGERRGVELRAGSGIRAMSFVDGSDLQVKEVAGDGVGMHHVRVRQFYQGLPVFGGEVVVHMNNRGITAVNGNFIPDLNLSIEPWISDAEAESIALANVGGEPVVEPSRVTRNQLSIYRTGLLEGRAGRNVLAYSVDVRGADKQVWVDAQTGDILNIISLRHDAMFRAVYSPQYVPSNEALFLQRDDSGFDLTPLTHEPWDNLFDFAAQTYNLFWQTFGRDSFDGSGAKMISVYLINNQCPNAYWNSQSTNYCPGFDLDDVVAHEWGHAYTEYTHGLIYQYQSGALNESYSDVWGETVDLLNNQDGIGGSNNAQPYPNGQRWLMGEDLGEAVQEALLRDMWDPDRLLSPGKVSSPNYHCDPSDGGGVHTNSGVPNHAFAILTDGTTYNGQTVAGLGLSKTAQIYYRAMSLYQTPTTNFPGHDLALKQSCQDLVGQTLAGLYGSGTIVIQGTDCDEVSKAMLAVEMSLPPTQCNFQPILQPNAPAACAGATTIYADDFETGIDGWTTSNMLGPTGDSPVPYYNWTVNSSLPDGRPGSAAYAVNSRTGTCAPGGDQSGTYSITSPLIAIPANVSAPVARFTHYVETETGFDGGNVKISVNGSDFSLVPQNAYVFNAPGSRLNALVAQSPNTNPKAGEFAWHGTDAGETTGSWGTTIIDLSRLTRPGDVIRIQFDFGIDGCNGILGWFVDDFNVYQCPTLAAPVLSIGAGYENPDTDGNFTLQWTRPSGASGPDTLQRSGICGPLFADNAESGMGNWDLNTGNVALQPNWTTANDKPQHSSFAFKAKAVEGAVNLSATMTTTNAFTVPFEGITTLTFSDWYMNEGEDSGTVEVATAAGSFNNWSSVYLIQRSALLPDATIAFGSEPLAARQADLTPFAGQSVKIRFNYTAGPENRPGSTPFGWYVDDVAVTNDSWTTLATVSGTSYNVANAANGTHCYRVRTNYQFGGTTIPSPYSNAVSVNVNKTTPPNRADLIVQNVSASNNQAREGDKVTITATLKNISTTTSAGASKTEFLLDDVTVLGLVNTPAIAANGTAVVSINWDTRNVKGPHKIKVTADRAGQVHETNEDNNSGTLNVTIQGNKVKNGSFETADSSGSDPAAWSGSDSAAGSTAWSSGGSSGAKSASITGNGGNVAVSGSPYWQSAPIDVSAGTLLTLTAAVKSTALSSASSIDLIYFGATGEVVSVLNALTVPQTTSGFVKLQKQSGVPKGATRVQIRLVGFALTDVAARGTVTFDDIGLY